MVRSAEVLPSRPSTRWRIPLLTGLLMCWVTPASAQVEIRVVDAESGVALPDAQVEVVRSDGERVVAEPTSDGGFSIPSSGTAEILVTSFSYLPRRVEVGAEVPQVIEMTPSPLEVDQITVTATRTETRLEDAPGTISVISRPQLQTRSVSRIDHAVSLTPGVYNHRATVLDDGHGSIYLRGLQGQKRTLILMDGVPMNGAYNGNFRFAGFAGEDVERVEVVRGPGSSLYGGYAMGGVINYITRTPDSRSIRAEQTYAPGIGGDNALANQSSTYLSAGERFGSVSVLASFRRHSTDGYSWADIVRTARDGEGDTPITGFVPSRTRTGGPAYIVGNRGAREVEDDAFTGKVTWDASPTTRLSAMAMRVTAAHGHEAPESYVTGPGGEPVWSGSLTVQDGGSRRISLSPTNFLASYGGKEHIFLSGSVETAIGGLELRGVGGYNDYESWYSTYDRRGTSYEGGTGKIVRNPSPSYVTDLQATTLLGDRHAITFGGTFKRDRADLAETNLMNWRDTETTDDLRYEAAGTVTTLAGFVQDQIEISDVVSTYVGLRFDQWRTHSGFANDVGKEGYPANYEARTSSFVSPRVALSIKPHLDTRLKFSVSRAFRGPTVFELYRTWTLSSGRVYYSNPDLGPETMTAFEAGIQQRFGVFTAGITGFHNDVKDLIDRRSLEGGDAIYINTGQARTRGVELQGEYRLAASARAFANYTWTDTEVIENETAPETEGKRLTTVPEHMANMGVELLSAPWTAGVHGRYVGKRFGLDTNEDIVNGVFTAYDPFFLMDLRAQYRWRSVQVGVSVDNVLDRNYYDYYLAPGRTLRLEMGVDVR